jgi:hypothetical protein
VTAGVRASLPCAALVSVPGARPDRYPWYRSLRVEDRRRHGVERFGAAGVSRFEIYAPSRPVHRAVRRPSEPLADRTVVIARNRVFGFVNDDNGILYLVALRVVVN